MKGLSNNDSCCTKKVFLETHNINNLNSGFGQFNLNLAKSLSNENDFLNEHELILNCSNGVAKRKIGTKVRYNNYLQITRYPLFRIKKKYNLWHSVNQNTKVEPASSDMPYLLTIHDINFMEEDKGARLNERINLFKEKLSRSSALVYISEYSKLCTHQHFEVPKVPEYVIYNGNTISNNSFKLDYDQCLEDKSIRPFIFTIGQIDEKKNMHTLVEMMVHLKGINLVIAGNNKTAYAVNLRRRIQELKLEHRIFMPGKISESEKIWYYKNCLALGFPSLREGFGLPVVEAMTFGKPVFLSDKTSLPEIGGRHAFYWSNFDPQQMALVFEDGMSRFETNRNDFANAYKDRAATFSWKKAAKEYIKVYKSILATNPV